MPDPPTVFRRMRPVALWRNHGFACLPPTDRRGEAMGAQKGCGMSGPDFFAVLGAWEDHLLALGRSPATVRNYLDCLCRAGRLARKDPRAFTEDDVVAVLGRYRGQGPARGMMLQALRAFFRWAEDREVLVDPTRRLPVRRPSPGPAPALTPAQLRELLRGAFRLERHLPPDRRRKGWAIMLVYATAGRISSVTGLRPEDVREGSVVFRRVKGGGSHEVPLGRMGRVAARHLLAYAGPRRRETLLGVGEAALWKWVREAAEAADVRHGDRFVWPHLLRHTAGSIAYEATLDHVGVADFLGHANLAHVRRYTGSADPRKRRVAEALSRLGSGA
ncbi:MAG TPA: tyrosine-type recombinase/integrase [Actinomycetota bacterium]|nr:tyrosine-type recombinase/integrase [Actinomycetota bacterium]